jgi:hypothetical protein
MLPNCQKEKLKINRHFGKTVASILTVEEKSKQKPA